MFKLTIEDDEGKTTVVPLARDEITIGRLEGNTIRLTERNVSRRHARLVRQNGALYIEDLSSFTGVRVNGAKIGSATPLREGDEVQIGDYRLALRGERTTAPITDRPTMPAIPAVAPPPPAPMGTVGGSVAIPTRASVAAMAAQPAVALAIVPAPAPTPAQPVAAQPAAVPAPAPAASGPSSPSATITQPGPAVRKSPPSPQPLAAQSPSPPQPFAAVPAVVQPVPTPKPRRRPPSRLPPSRRSRPWRCVRAAAAATPEVSDAQPTIPIRALGDTVPDPTAAGAAARLVVLTTDLQGMEFELDRPSVVIGRTDENDIVLPHRSISRHHAKIVRDGEHHTIVDLQSANGVRVNGEDYERIELNPGDVVELGHVKLRFVGALEDYVFKPGASGRGPLKLKLGAIGLGLVGLAAVAFVLYRKGAGFVRGGRAARRSPPQAARRAAVASAAAAAPAHDRGAGRAPPSPRPRPRSSPRPGRPRAPKTGRSPRRRSTGWAPASRTPACAATRSRSAAASTPRSRRRRSSRSSTRRRARRTTPRRSRATNRSRPRASTSAARSRATTKRGRWSSPSTCPPPTRRAPRASAPRCAARWPR